MWAMTDQAGECAKIWGLFDTLGGLISLHRTEQSAQTESSKPDYRGMLLEVIELEIQP